MADDNDDLARLLGRLAIDLQEQADVETTLRSIVDGAVRLIPGVRWAGISHVDGRDVVPRVPSDAVVATLDSLQSELDEGPCLTALREHRTVVIDDIEADARWPRFATAAGELGVGSVMSLQLCVRGANFGALNLYAANAFVYDDVSRAVGIVLAQHASVAMAASAADGHWRQAVGTRGIIGEAKGLLMQRNGVSGQRAFEMLKHESQSENIRLVEIAQWIVEQHESGVPRVLPQLESH